MSRLTKRNKDGTAWYNHTVEKDISNGEILEKLAHYEDLAEKGRLQELPCKPGETVWFYNHYKKKVEPLTVETFEITESGIMRIVTRSESDEFVYFAMDAFNGLLWPTKDEAEARMPIMGGARNE